MLFSTILKANYANKAIFVNVFKLNFIWSVGHVNYIWENFFNVLTSKEKK